MQITLICSFRTLVNLRSDVAFSHADRLHEALESACSESSSSTDATFSTERRPQEPLSYVKYTHLDRDCDTWATTPLAEVTLSPGALNAAQTAIAASLKFSLETLPPIQSFKIYIFDNTVAIAVLQISMPLTQADSDFNSPAELEQHLTNYAAASCRYATNKYVETFLGALHAAERRSSWWRESPLLRTGTDNVVFDDLREHSFPHWSDRQEPMLWAHRVYDLATVSDDEKTILQKLTRLHQVPSDQFYLVGDGTSYITSQESFTKFVYLNIIGQYFYTTLDCLSESQKRLLRKLSDHKKRSDFSRILHIVDSQQHMISSVSCDMLDYINGLQGINDDIFRDITESFRMSSISAMLEKRSQMIRDRIKSISASRTVIQQRFVAFILIIVGGIQVVDLVLNILWFARDDNGTDGIFGPIDLAKSISPDLALEASIAILLLAAGLWVLFGQRSR